MQHVDRKTEGTPAGALADFFAGLSAKNQQPYPRMVMDIPHMTGWKVQAFDIEARMKDLVVMCDGKDGFFLSAPGMLPLRTEMKSQISFAVEWMSMFLGQPAALIHYGENGAMRRFDLNNAGSEWFRNLLRPKVAA